MRASFGEDFVDSNQRFLLAERRNLAESWPTKFGSRSRPAHSDPTDPIGSSKQNKLKQAHKQTVTSWRQILFKRPELLKRSLLKPRSSTKVLI